MRRWRGPATMNRRRSKFTFYRDGFESLPPPDWLVKEIIPKDGLVLLFGQSGSGKTFVALDIGLSVTYGQSWHAHSTTKGGSVVYVAAEYTRSLKNRIAAWRQEHGHEHLINFITTKNPVQLHKDDEVKEFIRELKSTLSDGESISLIIFDTLARCIVGADESSAQEMGLVISNADRIREELNTAVMLVHHTVRDENRFRGSGVFKDGPTTVIGVEAGSGKSLTVTCKKQKDDEEFKPFDLYLTPAFGSCVLRTGGAELMMIRVIYDNGGSCSWSEWTTGSELAGIPKGGSFDRLKRAVEELKWVRKDGDRYTLTLEGTDALAKARYGQEEGAEPPLPAAA